MLFLNFCFSLKQDLNHCCCIWPILIFSISSGRMILHCVDAEMCNYLSGFKNQNKTKKTLVVEIKKS